MAVDTTEVAVVRTKVEGLREMMKTNFEHIQAQLDGLSKAVEKLSTTTVSSIVFDRYIEESEKRSIHLDDHHKRITVLEQTYRVLKILGGIALSVLIAILVALATGNAHIVWQ